MTSAAEPTLSAFLALVGSRRGHFRLESGFHAGLWLDLDGLFSKPRQVAPFVLRLSERLRRYAPEMVCGPLLGGALLAQAVATELGVEFGFLRQAPETGGGAGLYQARYRLPLALGSRVQGRRIALVDDVMSAGSSLRATSTELRSWEAVPVAVGALLTLGDTGIRHFTDEEHLPVETVLRSELELWPPADCPLCLRQVPLDDTSESADAPGATW